MNSKSDTESVWDYPRPPKLESIEKELTVVHNGETIAETQNGWRVLETSHPPNYYFPREDVDMSYLSIVDGYTTMCEWKGKAHYFDIHIGEELAEKAAWTYPEPLSNFSDLKDAVAFFASRVDECYVDGERVTPQPGSFYGGWITERIEGPFKGGPGTRGW